MSSSARRAPGPDVARQASGRGAVERCGCPVSRAPRACAYFSSTPAMYSMPRAPNSASRPSWCSYPCAENPIEAFSWSVRGSTSLPSTGSVGSLSLPGTATAGPLGSAARGPDGGSRSPAGECGRRGEAARDVRPGRGRHGHGSCGRLVSGTARACGTGQDSGVRNERGARLADLGDDPYLAHCGVVTQDHHHVSVAACLGVGVGSAPLGAAVAPGVRADGGGPRVCGSVPGCEGA
jgi:hypothetical protein